MGWWRWEYWLWGDAAFRPSQSLPAALHKGTRGPAGVSGSPM